MVYRFIFVGLIPLVLFSFPLYFQTTSILDASAKSTLIGYSKLAKSTLFSTLEKARSRLERLAESADGASLPSLHAEGFTRIIRLDANLAPRDATVIAWPMLNQQRIDFLRRRQTVLTAPYQTENGITLSLIAPCGDGFVAGEMDPVELWDLTRAGLYGPHGILMIIDEEGQLLASSSSGMKPLQGIWPKLPEESQRSGEDFLPGVGSTLWGYNEMWLEGAFGGGRWGIIVAQSSEGIFELPVTLVKSLLVLMGIAFCIIVMLSFNYVRYILSPILELVDATKRVSSDLSVRIDARTDDELGDLVNSFNDMTSNLKESREESVRLTSEAMVGRMAAMVAHQVNTPLAAMKARIELLERKHPAIENALRLLADQVDKIDRTVKALLGFARLRSKREKECNLAETAANVSALFRDSFEARGLDLEIVIPAGLLTVPFAAEDIQELMVNLLENARDSSLQAGTREDGQRRRTKLEVAAAGGELRIVIEDEGSGLTDDPEKLFDAFLTTKVHGTGLGLSICRRICKNYGGGISASNRRGGGARFEAILPLREEHNES